MTNAESTRADHINAAQDLPRRAARPFKEAEDPEASLRNMPSLGNRRRGLVRTQNKRAEDERKMSGSGTERSCGAVHDVRETHRIKQGGDSERDEK
ncbi:hypothetical protein PG997_003309 [Apiospora hydei]|uniref:Uncharacterized protein n=1 Tax=Apiospora hydei TaxID=1337664 RepID=A0ABR1WYU9_9PEZI